MPNLLLSRPLVVAELLLPKYVDSLLLRGDDIQLAVLVHFHDLEVQADTAVAGRFGGTGLGLAIVKHIVARHRGDLDIQSDFGKGSTFSVTFDAVA